MIFKDGATSMNYGDMNAAEVISSLWQKCKRCAHTACEVPPPSMLLQHSRSLRATDPGERRRHREPRDEIFQYTNEYTESPEYTKSIQTSLRSLPSIPKSHPRVTQKDTTVNQII